MCAAYMCVSTENGNNPPSRVSRRPNHLSLIFMAVTYSFTYRWKHLIRKSYLLVLHLIRTEAGNFLPSVFVTNSCDEGELQYLELRYFFGSQPLYSRGSKKSGCQTKHLQSSSTRTSNMLLLLLNCRSFKRIGKISRYSLFWMAPIWIQIITRSPEKAISSADLLL